MLHPPFFRRRRWKIPADLPFLPPTMASTSTIELPPAPTHAPLPSASRFRSVSNPPDHPVTPTRTRARRKRVALPVRVPQMSTQSNVFEGIEQVVGVHKGVPARYQACDWRLLYSTMRDGVSLQTLYKLARGVEPVVLAIRDSAGGVFGHYSSVGWKVEKGYFGNGEGFVWTAKDKEKGVEVFKWSRRNKFFMLGTGESLCVGGGGKFALFVEGGLEWGSSGRCDTFENLEGLSKEAAERFEVCVLEVWGLGREFRR